MDIPIKNRFQIWLVRQSIFWLNLILGLITKILFPFTIRSPQNILVYKIGNIGDIVCAIPAFITIRRNYPEAKITLLTSPGKKGAPGAENLLKNVWYLNEMRVYYAEDIDAPRKRKKFVKNLAKANYDLFIQLPDDLAGFRTLLRNLIFAKFAKSKSALGFKIRTMQIFKKTQVDYAKQETETESLLKLLKSYGIKTDKVEFDFNIGAEDKLSAMKLLVENKIQSKELIIALSPGGKREGNRWPLDRFRRVAEYLKEKYNARIVVLGGSDDFALGEEIIKDIKNGVNAAGRLSFLGTFEVLKRSLLLVANSTGTIHLAAAATTPAVGLYGIRDVFGRWFPYGTNNIVLYHRFLDCNYKNENCIKKSITEISLEEVKVACDKIIKP